ncbi:MAG: hypothetical protein U0527_08305 [Candidatus Eisenbacteria bacterium]
MFRSMLRSVAGFALASLVVILAPPGQKSWAAVTGGAFELLAADRAGVVRCEWGSDALLDPIAGSATLRVTRDEDGLLIVSDPEHPNAPLTPHIQAPLATGWIALPPNARGALRVNLLETVPVPWPASFSEEERAAVLAELPKEAAPRPPTGSTVASAFSSRSCR